MWRTVGRAPAPPHKERNSRHPVHRVCCPYTPVSREPARQANRPSPPRRDPFPRPPHDLTTDILTEPAPSTGRTSRPTSHHQATRPPPTHPTTPSRGYRRAGAGAAAGTGGTGTSRAANGTDGSRGVCGQWPAAVGAAGCASGATCQCVAYVGSVGGEVRTGGFGRGSVGGHLADRWAGGCGGGVGRAGRVRVGRRAGWGRQG